MVAPYPLFRISRIAADGCAREYGLRIWSTGHLLRASTWPMFLMQKLSEEPAPAKPKYTGSLTELD
jgi:hypothetical protein